MQINWAQSVNYHYSPEEIRVVEKAVDWLLDSQNSTSKCHPDSSDFHSVTGLSRIQAQGLMKDWKNQNRQDRKVIFIVFYALDTYADHLREVSGSQSSAVAEIELILEKWRENFLHRDNRVSK